MIDTINNPNLLGFYIWAYKNLEQVEYITSQIRKNYPNSDLVISSDNGEDFSFKVILVCHTEKLFNADKLFLPFTLKVGYFKMSE